MHIKHDPVDLSNIFFYVPAILEWCIQRSDFMDLSSSQTQDTDFG